MGDICIKIEYISQRKIIVLFRSSNMAVVHTLFRRDVKHVGNHSRPTPLLACVILFFVCIRILKCVVLHCHTCDLLFS